jgi:hypothetical protein
MTMPMHIDETSACHGRRDKGNGQHKRGAAQGPQSPRQPSALPRLL